ncbi:hypothetical protein BDZ89DRAFT_1068328 [Hymenopellis radicata]|nr:hypothetical protein BDZ89DRAFT_1068328 [Hymenopellis radicata]
MFSKSFFAFAFFVAVAIAMPMKRESTTCDFIMTPTPDLGAEELQTSIDYAVGHTVGEAYPNTLLTDDNSLVRHNDGTYDVRSIIEVNDVPAADVGATVEAWEGTVLDGLNVQWAVGAANCF